MYCVIVGGGMVGEYLARTLLAEGDQVALIEGDPQVATHLSETLEGPVLVIQGDGCEVARQEDAGVPHADIFVATTGHDEDNLASCEIANRVFGTCARERSQEPAHLPPSGYREHFIHSAYRTHDSRRSCSRIDVGCVHAHERSGGAYRDQSAHHAQPR